jgi:hypothetical protein
VAVSDAVFDPLAALRVLTLEGVRFVLIGGLGARLHGSPSVTNDTDICYERSGDNVRRLGFALERLGARLRGVADEVPFTPDAASLAAGDHVTFTTIAGNLDCLGAPAGTDGFRWLERNAGTFDVDGLSILVASLDDLIKMKLAAGRPKDAIEVEVLRAMQSRASEERPGGSPPQR